MNLCGPCPEDELAAGCELSLRGEGANKTQHNTNRPLSLCEPNSRGSRPPGWALWTAARTTSRPRLSTECWHVHSKWNGLIAWSYEASFLTKKKKKNQVQQNGSLRSSFTCFREGCLAVKLQRCFGDNDPFLAFLCHWDEQIIGGITACYWVNGCSFHFRLCDTYEELDERAALL